ncbi:MAG TPA: sulfatase-like hydrolase/transferase [Anaerolineales bacterium]|nr:sulfatase-like hydrolase/transferase [Anaerolineales bacterium]
MPFSRRDFLKLGSALSGAFAASRIATRLLSAGQAASAAHPNILIFVFDAMSAKNLSLHGYRRATTPNLERFAERATVYHQHYSAGSFTTPGTASLLTGLYPWTHRAINESGLIARKLAAKNLFRALGRGYQRLAFSQNIWANYLFGQFQGDIETILSPASFALIDDVAAEKFGGDLVNSHRAFDEFLFQDRNPPASLVFGMAERFLLQRTIRAASAKDYPRGFPRTTNYPIVFRIEDVFDGIMATISDLSSPSLAYFHIWPPHEPFKPRKRFAGLFNDGWSPESKPYPRPYHELNDSPVVYTEPDLAADRRVYDQSIADVDAEFGRLLDFLSSRGFLDSSHVVVTSDHGQLFERGVEGHITRFLYEPVVRVPLLISSPGQVTRRDVNIPTSSVDVLPTLAHLSGGAVPAWCEGTLLPEVGGASDPERSIFMMDAKENPAFAPLTNASFALRKGRYKLIYDVGFQKHDNDNKAAHFELYDIEADPEELNNIQRTATSVADAMGGELLSRIDTENAKLKRAE